MSIIVGLNATAEGRAALSRAIQEAEQRKAKLIVVTSLQGGKDFNAEEEQQAAAMLSEAAADLTSRGIEHEMRELVRSGDPASDILALSEETSAEMIVIGVRRRSPVGKLLLGSNAQRIILDAHCPVLAVKG